MYSNVKVGVVCKYMTSLEYLNTFTEKMRLKKAQSILDKL